jgi:hypothetical protein
MAKNKGFKLVGKARPSPLEILGNKKKSVLKDIKNLTEYQDNTLIYF